MGHALTAPHKNATNGAQLDNTMDSLHISAASSQIVGRVHTGPLAPGHTCFMKGKKLGIRADTSTAIHGTLNLLLLDKTEKTLFSTLLLTPLVPSVLPECISAMPYRAREAT